MTFRILNIGLGFLQHIVCRSRSSSTSSPIHFASEFCCMRHRFISNILIRNFETCPDPSRSRSTSTSSCQMKDAVAKPTSSPSSEIEPSAPKKAKREDSPDFDINDMPPVEQSKVKQSDAADNTNRADDDNGGKVSTPVTQVNESSKNGDDVKSLTSNGSAAPVEQTSNTNGNTNSHQRTSKQKTLQFAKLTEHATTPTRGTPLAAGYDLYSAYDCVVPAKGKHIVPTDIQIALPDGCYGRVAPRSGLTVKHFIDVGAGVIDQDYRGNVGVVLFNFSDKDFNVKKGERIAQLICEKIFLPDLQELPTLTTTERGSGGFGSTGTN